jgi:hypothetical protein
MRILNAFRRRAVEGEREFSLKLPGIRNPIHTKSTKSFEFTTFTRQGEIIDVSTRTAVTEMINSAQINTIIVSLGSYVNSVITDYTFTIVPTVPVASGSVVFITFPEQIQIPAEARDFDCSSSFTSLIKQASCSFAGASHPPGTVKIELLFADGVNKIGALDRFSVNIKGIKNPPTTQITQTIKVSITDKDENKINSKENNIFITTNKAFTIPDGAEVYPSSFEPYSEVDVYLNF